MDTALGAGLLGVIMGVLVIALRKYVVRDVVEMPGGMDVKVPLDPEQQEALAVVFGVLMLGFGIFALIVWLL